MRKLIFPLLITLALGAALPAAGDAPPKVAPPKSAPGAPAKSSGQSQGKTPKAPSGKSSGSDAPATK